MGTHTYFIAEIGQNHNGDMNVARKLIDMAAMPVFDYFTGKTLPGVDAVKFTKRDLDEELSSDVANRPYVHPNSFGSTYLEHRKALEFSIEQHAELEQYAHDKGLDFIETLCSPGCLALLEKVRVDAIKIASRDVTNIPLLRALAELEHKIIISTGMCTLDDLRNALEILSKNQKDISILHCLSQYPAEYKNINLRSIPFLKKQFPTCKIGYSDHSVGIVISAVAVALGAEIIEKHITLNRNMKGSDHAGSLEPEGLWRVVRDIRNVEESLGIEQKVFNEVVRETKDKLARSLAIQKPLKAGAPLCESDLCMRSPGTGLQWKDRTRLIGRRAKIDIPANSLLNEDNFE